MCNRDIPSDNRASPSREKQGSIPDTQRDEDTRNKGSSIDLQERQILVYSSIGLSILGVIAFLITGQLGVVVAMNAPFWQLLVVSYF